MPIVGSRDILTVAPLATILATVAGTALGKAEGLEELQLSAVLGQGASGVVLQGTLGCTPVAVKLIEMPDGVRSGGRWGAGRGGDGSRIRGIGGIRGRKGQRRVLRGVRT